MVTFHPKDASSKNEGERLIIEAFRDQDSHPEIHVYHSVKIGKSEERTDGEADFIVLIPNKGIVVIEAKGPSKGEIVDGKLKLENVPHPEQDPFEQVQIVHQELKNYLYRKGHGMPITFAVWLSTIKRNQIHGTIADLEKDETQLLTSENLLNPVASVLKVMDKHNLEAFGKKHARIPDLFNPAKVDLARQAIRAEISFSSDKEYWRDKRETELQELEEKQKKILSLFQHNEHIYFYGPAGTGKSLMLNELAIRAAERGEEVLLTCWNKMVTEELQEELAEVYSNITFINIGDLMLEFAQVEDRPNGGDDWYFKELPALAIAASKANPGKYSFDFIAVDEYQDVASHPIILDFLRTLGKEQSWATTKLVLAGDKHQQIMRGKDWTDDPYALAKENVPELVNVKLTTNYRNSPRIGQALEALLQHKPFERLKIYEELERTIVLGEIDIIEVDPEEQPNELMKRIEKLRQEYDDDELRVLSASRTKLSTLLKIVESEHLDNISAEYLKENLKDFRTGDGSISWRSIPRYKGLEADAVVIVDANEEQWNYWESSGTSMYSLFYVGFSRGKHRVTVICDHFVAEKLRALNL